MAVFCGNQDHSGNLDNVNLLKMSAVQAATSAYHELMQLYEQKELIHRLVSSNGSSNGSSDTAPQGKMIGNPADRPDSSTISPPPVATFGDHLTNSNDKPIALKKIPFSIHSPAVVTNCKDSLPQSPSKMDKNNHIANNINGNNRTSPVPPNYAHHVTRMYHSL